MDDAEYEELEWLHHDEASDALAVVVTNCPPAKAPAIARALVERRVAACVNMIPGIQSVYQWEGQLHMEAETTLMIKTARHKRDDLVRVLRSLHPYEVPEIMTLLPDGVSRAYGEWVAQVVDPTPESS